MAYLPYRPYPVWVCRVSGNDYLLRFWGLKLPTPTLEDWEVSLIKAMLARKFQNNTIQFYFNRPDRAVNSGRISEIKSGDRWADVPPADNHDLDEFLDHHPYTQNYRLENEPDMPVQKSAASQFRFEDDGLISLDKKSLTDELSDDDPAIDAFNELSTKIAGMLSVGSNHLGPLEEKISAFNEAVSAGLAEAHVVKVWMRGNALRQDLRAHRLVEGSDEFHPAKLDPICASHLADIVEAFNVLAALTPRIAELDHASLGPGVPEIRKALSEFEPLLPDALAISTEDAASELRVEVAEFDSEGEEAARQANVAGGTVFNFVLTAIKGVYREVRKQLGEHANELWNGVRLAVGIKVGSIAWEFLSTNFPVIRSVIEQLASNPAVLKILDLLRDLLA
ncbi:hypothetical protein [Roseivivax sp. THAF40]|uniref:hypothetical protein n=1 Tax=Roseivivax sp. THAF40 TaxID=2587858 RepID=UPI001561C71C|nr:hypothetical protein [Roseivivax sp. THAF40]